MNVVLLPDDEAEAEKKFLRRQLVAFNVEKVGRYDERALTVVARDPQGEIMGGVVAITYWQYLWLETFWVHESVRRCGYGKQILAEAEREARARGCRFAFTDTLIFQAPWFYQARGYDLFGWLEKFAGKHSRFFFMKRL